MVQRLGYYRGPYQLFFITNNSYIFHLDDKALPKQRAENSFNTKSIPSCNFQYSYCFTFGRLEWSKWNMFAPSKTNGTNWKWSGIVYLGESDILSDTFDTSICSRYNYCVHLHRLWLNPTKFYTRSINFKLACKFISGHNLYIKAGRKISKFLTGGFWLRATLKCPKRSFVVFLLLHGVKSSSKNVRGNKKCSWEQKMFLRTKKCY